MPLLSRGKLLLCGGQSGTGIPASAQPSNGATTAATSTSTTAAAAAQSSNGAATAPPPTTTTATTTAAQLPDGAATATILATYATELQR